MSKRVPLKPIHKPRRRIAQVSIHAVDTPDRDLLAIRLSLNIVVTGTKNSPFELGNAVRHGIVIGRYGLLTGDPGSLRRRRDRDVGGAIDEKHRSGNQILGINTVG